MADRKISDLTALTTPASGDYLPIVDISEAAAASKNKRITIEELMRGVPDGTAAAPGIAFETDPNTGIYSPGADQLAVATNGTGRLFIDASGNVGIGVGSPITALQVVGTATFGNGVGGRLQATTDSNLGYIDSLNNTSTEWQPLIQRGTEIQFHTNTAGVTPVEKVRITSAGLVGIGTSSPQGKLHVVGDSATPGVGNINISNGAYPTSGWAFRIPDSGSIIDLSLDGAVAGTFRSVMYFARASGNVGIGTTSPLHRLDISGASARLNNGTNASTDLYFGPVSAAGNYSYINWNNTAGSELLTLYTDGGGIRFSPAGSERARLDSSGRLLVGTSTANASGAKLQTADGLTFPATQVASADPNTLDDYEEGTWTPGQGAGVTVVGTYSSVGRYTKIGRVVNYEGYFLGSTSIAFNPAGGNLTTGLPFTVVAGSGTNGAATNGPASSWIIIGAGGTVVNGSASIAATTVIYFSGQYIV